MNNRSRVYRRAAAAVMLSLFASAALSTSAFAWGCFAEADNGAYGYSYNYSNRSGAIERALEECSARGRGCEIMDCDPDK